VWIVPLVTAIVSALAALVGIILANVHSSRVQARQQTDELERWYRSERLTSATAIIACSHHFRSVVVAEVLDGDGLKTPTSEIAADVNQILTLASCRRLLKTDPVEIADQEYDATTP
jgi:hypothetical protein